MADDVDLTGLQELFWMLRNDPAVADKMRSDPGTLLEHYEVPPAIAALVVALDVKRLYELGTNPYLLFFAALELGMSRDAYYGRMSKAVGRR